MKLLTKMFFPLPCNLQLPLVGEFLDQALQGAKIGSSFLGGARIHLLHLDSSSLEVVFERSGVTGSGVGESSVRRCERERGD